MHVKTPTGRNPKGAVSIIESHGWLQLRFRFGAKRHYISLGFPDPPNNRKLAESRARQIELDILSNNFDTSLAKYKPQSALSPSDALTNKREIWLTLEELWESYTEHRQPQMAETTLKIQYAAVASHIAKLPVQSVNDAFVIRDWLLRHLSSDSARRTITQLSERLQRFFSKFDLDYSCQIF